MSELSESANISSLEISTLFRDADWLVEVTVEVAVGLWQAGINFERWTTLAGFSAKDIIVVTGGLRQAGISFGRLTSSAGMSAEKRTRFLVCSV